MRASPKTGEGAEVAATVPLKPFRGQADRSDIPYRFDDYLELVDWTGRMTRSDKRAAIDHAAPPIMRRLNIDAETWRLAMRPRGNLFGRAMGRLDHLRLHANTLGQSWVRGLRHAQALYST